MEANNKPDLDEAEAWIKDTFPEVSLAITILESLPPHEHPETRKLIRILGEVNSMIEYLLISRANRDADIAKLNKLIDQMSHTYEGGGEYGRRL